MRIENGFHRQERLEGHESQGKPETEEYQGHSGTVGRQEFAYPVCHWYGTDQASQPNARSALGDARPHIQIRDSGCSPPNSAWRGAVDRAAMSKRLFD